MDRIHIRMVRFGIVFVLLAAGGMFGAVWLLGGGADTGYAQAERAR